VAPSASWRKLDPARSLLMALMGTQWSADGQWWWNGQEWVAAARLRRPGASVPDAAPSPSLLTFGAFACLALALSSYVILLTPLAILVPFTSIISIAIGQAARHSLPKTGRRDRVVAAIGIVVAALPLALIILAIMVLQLMIAYVMITGNHSIG
jgi:hypothetical protein